MIVVISAARTPMSIRVRLNVCFVFAIGSWFDGRTESTLNFQSSGWYMAMDVSLGRRFALPAFRSAIQWPSIAIELGRRARVVVGFPPATMTTDGHLTVGWHTPGVPDFLGASNRLRRPSETQTSRMANWMIQSSVAAQIWCPAWFHVANGLRRADTRI